MINDEKIRRMQEIDNEMKQKFKPVNEKIIRLFKQYSDPFGWRHEHLEWDKYSFTMSRNLLSFSTKTACGAIATGAERYYPLSLEIKAILINNQDEVLNSFEQQISKRLDKQLREKEKVSEILKSGKKIQATECPKKKWWQRCCS